MFYKIVAASNFEILSKMIEDFLHHGWILAGGIAFDGQNYLQAITRP